MSAAGRDEATRPTREQAIAAAGHALAVALAEQAARTPHEAAVAAWAPGGPSVDQLEQRIRAQRGLPAVNTKRGVA